jgi:large subunit ribosomal protein L24e
MVERRVCTFCGSEIEPGTGRMYVKKDGVVYNFCTSKCFKNMVVLGRVPRRTTWTRYFEREKEIRMKGGPEAVAQTKKARKVKKAEAAPEAEEKATEAKPEKKEDKPKEEPAPKTEEKKEPAKEKKAPAKKPEKAAPKKEKPKPEEGEKG